MGHEIEIFTSDCYLCRETVEIVQKAKCKECTLTEYNLSKKCESEICLTKAKKYGIKTTPTIVVDGRIAIEGKPTVEQVKKVLDFIGQMTVPKMLSQAVTVPPVKGFYKGQEILFIHTEASDQQVASMLTGMMGSPVILVPSLKQISDPLLGDVYVFTNGIRGGGPFGRLKSSLQME